MAELTEAELIAESLIDKAAYAELVDRYKDALYRHCFAILRDEDAAEDIAQETFITVFYNLHRYNSKYRFATWIFKISTNKCLNYLKKEGKEIAAGDELIASIASARPGPYNEAVYSELHDAVSNLNPRYRAVISLYYWQGLDYASTAAVMGVPVNSVRVWLKRAKHELRKDLA